MTCVDAIDGTHVRRLLDRVTERRRYQARVRSEQAADFDFFTAVTERHNEKAHSRMLAALLDPRGRHGQGGLFLELFLREIGLHDAVDGAAADAYTVELEHHIPAGPGGVTQDRYADVLIEGPDDVVVIENKVQAGEGKGQIPDYCRWLGNRGKSRRVLVFLTPTGRPPEEVPPDDCRSAVELKCMGYAVASGEKSAALRDKSLQERMDSPDGGSACTDLSAWLTHCLSEIPLLPPVREVVAQYRKVVARIGGRDMTSEERDAIASVACEDSQAFAAALAVTDTMRSARAKVQGRFWSDLVNRLQLDFSTVKTKANSEKEIERYLTPYVSNRPRPGIQLLTDIHWRGEALYVEIELLPDTDKNFLTIKLLRPKTPDGSIIDAQDDRVFNAIREKDVPISHSACPERSFIVGRVEVNGGEQLDLTNFVPPAHRLADSEQRKRIVEEVCQVTHEFCNVVGGRVRNITPA